MWESLTTQPSTRAPRQVGRKPAAVKPPKPARKQPANPWNLSLRQSQVLRLFAQGLTYQQMGADLGVSFATVALHAHEAIKRTAARNLTHAAVMFDRFERNGVEQ